MTTIAPNDTNIVYSPATWRIQATEARTINSGAYIRALVAGNPTDLTATFDVSGTLTPLPRISWRVDAGPWSIVNVASSISITLRADTTFTEHFVEIVVDATTETQNRWSGVATAVVFKGFSATATISTVAVTLRGLKGACLGDSITEGVRTLAVSAGIGDVGRNSAMVAWAYPLTELLGAEIGVIGFGGDALAGGGSGSVPKFATVVPSLWSGVSRPDLASLNFFAMMVGTNDSGATDATVTTEMTGLLAAVLSAVSATCKIIVFRPWNGTKATAIQAGIAACSAPARVKYVDTTGWWNSADSSDSLHPYGYTNQARIAPLAAAAIRSALTSGAWIMRGGTLTPIG